MSVSFLYDLWSSTHRLSKFGDESQKSRVTLGESLSRFLQSDVQEGNLTARWWWWCVCVCVCVCVCLSEGRSLHACRNHLPRASSICTFVLSSSTLKTLSEPLRVCFLRESSPPGRQGFPGRQHALCVCVCVCVHTCMHRGDIFHPRRPQEAVGLAGDQQRF